MRRSALPPHHKAKLSSQRCSGRETNACCLPAESGKRGLQGSQQKRERNRLVVLEQLPELRGDVVAQVLEGLLEVLRGAARLLELHLGHLHNGFLELRRDNAPGDLAVPGLGDRLHRAIMEVPDHLHHADRLRERAHEVILREPVLLQEVLTDDACGLERALLVLRRESFPTNCTISCNSSSDCRISRNCCWRRKYSGSFSSMYGSSVRMYLEKEIVQFTEGKCLRWASFLSKPQKTCTIDNV